MVCFEGADKVQKVRQDVRCMIESESDEAEVWDSM